MSIIFAFCVPQLQAQDILLDETTASLILSDRERVLGFDENPGDLEAVIKDHLSDPKVGEVMNMGSPDDFDVIDAFSYTEHKETLYPDAESLLKNLEEAPYYDVIKSKLDSDPSVEVVHNLRIDVSGVDSFNELEVGVVAFDNDFDSAFIKVEREIEYAADISWDDCSSENGADSSNPVEPAVVVKGENGEGTLEWQGNSDVKASSSPGVGSTSPSSGEVVSSTS